MRNSFKVFLVVIICFAATATGTAFSSLQADPPRIDSISAPALGRAGRLRIHGSNFGTIVDGGYVLIDGVRAPVSRWSDSLIVAYVPEAARITTVPVQVVAKSVSNTFSLDVTGNSLRDIAAPQANGSIKWQFEVDGDYMEFRPTIGPDGTVYFQDVNGHLYALNPDGSVKWIFQGGYPYGPVAVGTNSTVYIASGGSIQAVSSAGTALWHFTDPDSQGVIGGPTVGPDGKIYAVMDLLGLGAIALSPVDGHLVWSNPGNPRVAEYGESGLELVFGPSSPGGQPDQFYFACDNSTINVSGHLYAFSLNGNQRWAAALGGVTRPPQVAVAPNGTISLGVAAIDPSNGSVKWSAYSALGSGSDLPPDLGPDGTVYVIAQYQSALAALSGQTGAVRWRIPGVSFEQGPVVSPLNDVVVTAGRDNYGLPGYFKAFTTSGQLLWQINLPGEPYPGMFEFPFQRGRFSADGTTVYMGTSISGEPEDNLHCYLYAIQTAQPQNCSFSVSPLNASFSSGGGEGSVNVTAPGGCGWTATSNAAWIGVTSATSFSGSDVVTYVLRENWEAGPRTGTISIAGQTFTITQDGTNNCTFTISPKMKSFSSNGGTGTVNVSTSSGCEWTATSNASWLTITAAADGNLVAYSVAANLSKVPRVGTMLIAGNTFTVKQKPR
jgi:IPT/TIG domain-containing protein/BACON domain-containing protein/putative pyrroloquinoline-quinone-binding quinoprotein/putative pyrroloquinoline-quinone binding quinoprotein